MVATVGKLSKENFLLRLKECKFRYNTKTTQENLYQKLLKLIRGLISSKTESQLKIRLAYLEQNFKASKHSNFKNIVKFDFRHPENLNIF